MTSTTIAAIGCTGPIGGLYVRDLLARGLHVRVLARDADSARAAFPRADVQAGSLLNPADVARALDGVDAALAVTPMGMRNDPEPEIAAGRAIASGAAAAQVPHLIYTSVLGADHRRGVGVLDAKFEIERLLADAGVPCSILRCGSYMEDVFDSRVEMLRKGRWLFPVTATRRFTYTSQHDIPRFVAEALIAGQQVLGGAVNFVSPGTFSVSEVEELLSRAAGWKIRALPKMPVFYAFKALQPVFNYRNSRFSS
ncbi:MAG TPA: NmrA family NAD(P)-binding protein, partial [Ilumatobacteraceae bacterium]|nr:NmrA family NAD(P)-binding protein [Ilumatobacteraceae bacterium]